MKRRTKHNIYYVETTRWIANCTVNHDIYRRNKCVIPAGTKHVDIAYRCAPWTFVNEDGEIQRGNLYKINGRIY